MNKIMSLPNIIIETINHSFKLIITVCFIIFLLIFYQFTLNQRYQYHETVSEKYRNIVIFDTRKGEMYSTLRGSDDDSHWNRWSPFSEDQSIERQ